MSNKSKARNDLYNSLMNPILANLITPTDRTYDAAKNGGLGWISIPTTANSGLDTPLSDLNEMEDYINFLIVKVYTPEESKIIFKNLNNGGDPATGEDIVFDDNGHISINDDTGSHIMYNPIIPPGFTDPSNLDPTKRGNTIDGKYSKYIVGKTYYISSKVVINPKLNYILYTKDTLPSETSIYYLLYNPIHRKSFQDYYRSLLEYDAPDDSWTNGILLNPGPNKGYQDSNIQTDQNVTAIGYKNIISRYCNAFRIPGEILSNGQISEHYADPSCNMALSPDDAVLAFTLGANYTQATLARKYWAHRPDGSDGYSGYQTAKADFKKTTGPTDSYWPCPDKNSVLISSPYDFCRNTGIVGGGSKSFMNVLTNAYINNIPSISSVQNPLNRGVTGNTNDVQCKLTSVQIVNCNPTYNIGGNVTNSNINTPISCQINNVSTKISSNEGAKKTINDANTAAAADAADAARRRKKSMDPKLIALIILALIMVILLIKKFKK